MAPTMSSGSSVEYPPEHVKMDFFKAKKETDEKAQPVTKQRHPDDILDPAAKRHDHLDLTRILCVAMVCVEHGASAYGKVNAMFSQCWVLQILWVVSGISWGLSSRPLGPYLTRLSAYFAVGVSFNFLAFVVHGKDWRSNPWDVVFQFWFVVGLGVYCTVTLALKPVLRQARARSRGPNVLATAIGSILEDDGERGFTQQTQIFTGRAERLSDQNEPSAEELKSRTGDIEASPVLATKVGGEHEGRPKIQDHGRARIVCQAKWFLILGGLLALELKLLSAQRIMHQVGLWTKPAAASLHLDAWGGLTYWLRDSSAGDLVGQLGFTAGSIWITYWCARLLRSPGWVAWILLSYIYVGRALILPMLYGQCRAERFFIGFELFLLGLVANILGMTGRMALGALAARYWIMFPILGTILWDPTWYGRFDTHPPSDTLTLVRVKACQAGCVVAFLLAGESMFDSRIVTVDGFGWLGDWAMWAFLTHKAVHIAVPEPFSWLTIIGLLPVCWAWRRAQPRTRRPAPASEGKPIDI